MKTLLAFLVPLLTTAFAMANTAPTPVIVSATMRTGTTLMDVVYRVNDPDDATVKVRALAFINGTRSFANVIKPTAFVEGTAANLGDAITTNTDHTLTWDVAVDWSIDVGQLKFEILALDGRGLLQFDWISIPAAGGNPALTISKDTPASNKLLDALFWQYASGDPGMSLAGGVVTGTAASGNFSALQLANGTTPNSSWGAPYVFKQMNLDPATSEEVTYANTSARGALLNTGSWHPANRPYGGVSAIVGWGRNQYGELNFTSIGWTDVIAIAAGGTFGMVLKGDGTVVSWGTSAPVATALTGVTAIDAGVQHFLALKSDGTVVGLGDNYYGQITIPAGLNAVTTISAGNYHSLARTSDGIVVAWGSNQNGQTTMPGGLVGVKAVSAGLYHSLALKSDGTVVGWGGNTYGEASVPAGLTGVVAIEAGYNYSLALKADGTVVGWGIITVPTGLTGVTAIAAGSSHALALKSDGTVVGWGLNNYGQTTIPSGLKGVTSISAGYAHSMALKARAL